MERAQHRIADRRLSEQQGQIYLLEWPNQSLQLNPKEHLWQNVDADILHLIRA